jgi:DNA-3-methyladenine glycosylase
VVISEVEAYAPDDPASHSFRGETSRNTSMFGPAGTLYVYRSYGIHWCANVVTGDRGDGAAVLIRAGVPVQGIPTMVARRGRGDHLADGPGKLCQALGISGEHDGLVLDGHGPIRLEPGDRSVAFTATPRIGITRAVELPWRFLATGPLS